MLSSKLKSWVESHLTRKNKSSERKVGNGGAGLSHSSGALPVSKEVDRITHPAASLVNLVPAVPLCSSSGRSNAGVVIRLQNDFAAAAAAAAASSGPGGSTSQRHHPSWTQSPVMLAWNTKLARVQQQPNRLFDPPLSPTPPPSASSTIQQKPSPTGSDWTQSTQSFAADSGCGDTNEGTLSSAADFTTVASSDRINATPTLSSPESAYSTGCSDGVSPVSQDGLFEPLVLQQQHKEPLAPWRRSLLDGEASNSSTATQSPARTRPAIRTNPWLPVRTSLTSTSDRASWMTDATPETVLSEPSHPAAVKETDIVSSDDDQDLQSALAAADRQMDMLCDSLEQLMDEQELRRSFRRSPPSPAPAATKPARPEHEASCWNADDQYSQLIRQTEEILLQLENDELLLAAARKQPEEPAELVRKAPVSARRRLRKTRRRCSSRSSARDLDYSSTDSSDCDYSAPTRGASAASGGVGEWSRGYRPARRAASTATADKVNARFNRNGRVTTQQQQQQPRMDRWLASSQRTSCTPDVGFEHDRPPSPAPMDPHCHWPTFSTPSVSSGPARPSYRASTRSYRHSTPGSTSAPGAFGSCPSSPAVGYSSPRPYQWRQSVNREQQRLESQIAFLRQQLKDVTDDYYYDRLGNTPSSSD